MTLPPPPANQKAMVRVLVVAIVIMTAAIIAILIAMIARFMAPSEADSRSAPPAAAAGSGATLDFAAAPEVEIGLPPGARVLAAHVAADRVTLEIETVHGERAVYTAPLTAYDAPVRLVYRTLE